MFDWMTGEILALICLWVGVGVLVCILLEKQAETELTKPGHIFLTIFWPITAIMVLAFVINDIIKEK